MPEKNKKASIEVFRVGTFTPMGGKPITFSAEDLKSMAVSYDAETSAAPMVVGHPKTDDPAFGWADCFSFNDATGVLSADLKDIEPSFADAVAKGHYKKVSLALFSPNSSANPKPGSYYPKHIGFLGAVPPAVPGLQPVSFADVDDADILMFEASMDFGSFDAENVGSLFRGIRDFFIEKYGKDTADEVIPSWRIDWVNDLDLNTDDSVSGFASTKTSKKKKKEKVMSKPDNAEFAAREAELDQRQAVLDEREQEAREAENLAFAESLITDEKLIPANKDKVVALLNAASASDTTVSFAEGDEVDLAQGIRDIFESQPKVVSFGEHDLGGDIDDNTAPLNFATADNATVDAESAALDRKAQAYMRDHPGTEYMDAVSAVQSL